MTRETINELLSKGQDKAITARELASCLGVRNRQVTLAIQAERLHGVPILACGDGYYLPADDEERDEYIARLKRRHGEIGKTLHALEDKHT